MPGLTLMTNDRAIIYRRVSSADQVSGTSLETQLADCTAAAVRDGMTVVKVYTDAGLSAKTADRRGLVDALDYCRRYKPAVVYVHKLDRLSRNVQDALVIRSKLRAAGVELRSATEAVTTDPAGELLSTVILGVAQFDNQVRAERTRRGMRERALSGGWPFQPPKGYRRAMKGDVPVLEMDELGLEVRRILGDYVAGRIDKTGMYDAMVRAGFRRTSVPTYLRQRVICGIIQGDLTDGRPIRGQWDPIVDVETWQAVQRMYSSANAERCFRRLAATHGVLCCPVCGRLLTAYKMKGKVYQKCTLGHVAIPAARAIEQALEILRGDDVAGIMRRLSDLCRQKLQAAMARAMEERDRAAAEAAKVRAKLDRLMAIYLDGTIDQAVYREQAAILNRQLAAAEVPVEESRERMERTVEAMHRAAERLADPVSCIAGLPPDQASHVMSLIFGRLEVRDGHVVPKVEPRDSSLWAALEPFRRPVTEWLPRQESNLRPMV